MGNTARPQVMGILNLTPDSFWDGNRYFKPADALRHALRLQDEGADMLDVGAESTRPGSQPVSLQEERRRLFPVLERLTGRVSIPVSVDTNKASIAEEALAMGATIINDTSALSDPDMARTCAKGRATLVLMHRQGSTKAMQRRPRYKDCVGQIAAFLAARAETARRAGIPNRRVWIDPGIGFGKTLRHNLEILRNLESLASLGHRVVVGISRKSFLGKLLDAPPEYRLTGSVAAGLVAVLRGADILRVHDVRETKEALKVLDALHALKLNNFTRC